MELDPGRYWICVLGPVEPGEKMPEAFDGPPRSAAETAFSIGMGRQAQHCASGWSADEETAMEVLDTWCAHPKHLLKRHRGALEKASQLVAALQLEDEVSVNVEEALEACLEEPLLTGRG